MRIKTAPDSTAIKFTKKESRCIHLAATRCTISPRGDPMLNIVPRQTCFLATNIYRRHRKINSRDREKCKKINYFSERTLFSVFFICVFSGCCCCSGCGRSNSFKSLVLLKYPCNIPFVSSYQMISVSLRWNT